MGPKKRLQEPVPERGRTGAGPLPPPQQERGEEAGWARGSGTSRLAVTVCRWGRGEHPAEILQGERGEWKRLSRGNGMSQWSFRTTLPPVPGGQSAVAKRGVCC